MPLRKRTTPGRKRTFRRRVLRRPTNVHHVMRHTFSQHIPHVYPHSMFYQQPSAPLPKDSITIHNYQPNAHAHNLPVVPHTLPPQVNTPVAQPSVQSPAMSPRNLFSRTSSVSSMVSTHTDIDAMNNAALKHYARTHNINLHGNRRKSAIKRIIREHITIRVICR